MIAKGRGIILQQKTPDVRNVGCSSTTRR